MTYDETVVSAGAGVASRAERREESMAVAEIDRDSARRNSLSQREPDSVSQADQTHDRIGRLGEQLERVTRMLDRRLSLLERNMLSREEIDAWRAASETRVRAEFENRLELSEARMRQRINAALAVGGRRLDEIGAAASARVGASDAAIADLRSRIEAIEARRKPARADGVSGEIGGPGPLSPFGAPDNPVRQPPALAVIEGGRLRIAPEALPKDDSPGLDPAAQGPAHEEPAALAQDAPAWLGPESEDADFDPRAPRSLDGPGRFLILGVAAGLIALMAGAGATVGLAHEGGVVPAQPGAEVTIASPH